MPEGAETSGREVPLEDVVECKLRVFSQFSCKAGKLIENCESAQIEIGDAVCFASSGRANLVERCGEEVEPEGAGEA